MSEEIIKANRYIAENRGLVNTRFRNKYHVMPPIGWMNDPNGFNFAFGKYHLFYQFHPYSSEWGPMHWGHFVSDDLISWKELPVAFAPDTPYDKDGCFSGTSIISDGRLYVMYTAVSGDRQTQALAVSDDGVNFKKEGQVIGTGLIPPDSSKTDFRDPKVFEKNGAYYCLVGATDNNVKGRILTYKSHDLTAWEYVGKALQDDRTNVCECPDYFELDGKEILIYSPQYLAAAGYNYQNQHSNLYAIGKLNFESGEFEKAYEGELDNGFDFYAAQTLLSPDGRRIMIAWMSMWDRTPVTKDDGWSGGMIIPRELTVIGNRLYQKPVREIEKYRNIHYHIDRKQIVGDFRLPDLGAAQDITVTFKTGKAQKVGFKLFCGKSHGVYVYYDAQKECAVFDRTNMGTEIYGGENESDAYVRYGKVNVKNGLLKIRLLLDVSSCEVFFGDGECVMSANIYADRQDNENFVFAEGGTTEIQRLDEYNLETNKNILEEIQ